MKTLVVCSALILAASSAALADHGASDATARSDNTLRIVHIGAASTTKPPADCERATWPNIPASCLQRDDGGNTLESAAALGN